MILSWLLTRLNGNLKEALAGGLTGGLAYGLVFGLVGSLAGGLAGGLVFSLAGSLAGGLVFGLAGGLTGGLAFGLAGGLVGGLVFGLAGGLANAGLIGFGWEALAFVFIASNLVMLAFDKVKQKRGEDWLWFIAKREAETLFEWLIIVVNALNAKWLIEEYATPEFYAEALKWFGYVGVGLLAIALVIVVLRVKYEFHQGKIKERGRKK